MSSGKHRKEKDCLNCGHHVEEHYCSHCGQENIEIREDALHMITHAVADYFHFESKFFGTIKPLLFQPGYLSKLYVSGKRVCFIHPIRLYIFISIVFFLVILSQGKKSNEDVEKDTTSIQTEDEKQVSIRVEKLQQELDNPSLTQAQRDSLVKIMVKEFRSEFYKPKNFTGSSEWLNKTDTTVAAYENRQKALPTKEKDNFIKHYIARRTLELQKYPNAKEKIQEEILHNIPKMMFILLPLFALILKLVYFRSKKYYYEHLIYSFHVHSALFLSFLILTGLKWFFHLFYDISNTLGCIWSIYILWYIYRSLRTFYGSKRWVTVAKILFLMFSYLIVFAISSVIVIAVTMMMI
jgi:hypothetical protein